MTKDLVQIKSVQTTRGEVTLFPSHARVVFEPVSGFNAEKRAGLLECLCGELIWFDTEKKLWICSGCGIDMLPREAILLMNDTEDMLSDLRSYAYEKAGKSWRLEKFLRRLLALVR